MGQSDPSLTPQPSQANVSLSPAELQSHEGVLPRPDEPPSGDSLPQSTFSSPTDVRAKEMLAFLWH